MEASSSMMEITGTFGTTASSGTLLTKRIGKAAYIGNAIGLGKVPEPYTLE
jgi:hypothetical protein